MSDELTKAEIGNATITSEAVWYSTEASLSDGIAAHAEVYGWTTRREVVIPNWGRLDLILTSPLGVNIAVEVKLQLAQPAQIRKAFMQADGYRRWLGENYVDDLDVTEVYLAAAKIGWDAVKPVWSLYPGVKFASVPTVLERIWNGDRDADVDRYQLRVMQLRQERLARIMQVRTEAIARVETRLDAEARVAASVLAEKSAELGPEVDE